MVASSWAGTPKRLKGFSSSSKPSVILSVVVEKCEQAHAEQEERKADHNEQALIQSLFTYADDAELKIDLTALHEEDVQQTGEYHQNSERRDAHKGLFD